MNFNKFFKDNESGEPDLNTPFFSRSLFGKKINVVVAFVCIVFLASVVFKMSSVTYREIMALVTGSGTDDSGNLISMEYQQGVNGYSGSKIMRLSSTYYIPGKNDIGSNTYSEQLDSLLLMNQLESQVKYDSRVLLSFENISSPPAGTKLKSASLDFYYTDFYENLPLDIKVYPLSVNWDYSSSKLGWTNRTDTEKWATPGVGAPGADVLPYGPYTVSSGSISSLGKNLFMAKVSLDKDMVESWLSGNQKPSFVMINTVAQKGIRVLSNSYSDTTKRPRLNLVFEKEPPVVTPPTTVPPVDPNPTPTPTPTSTPSSTVIPTPTGLVATPISFEQVDLKWKSVSGGKSYRVFRDGVLVGTASTYSYTDKPLKAATRYAYTVQAVSVDGKTFSNVSAPVYVVTKSTGTINVDATRPRLLGLSPTKIAYLKNIAAQNDPRWVALKNKADEYARATVVNWGEKSSVKPQINAGYRGSGYYEALPTLSVAYVVSGNKIYADKAIEVMRSMDQAGMCILVSGNREPELYAKDNCKVGDSSNGYPLRFILPSMAIGYDLLHSYLSSDQKQAFATQMEEWSNWAESGRAYNSTGPAISNFFTGYYLGLSYAASAIGNDFPFGMQLLDRAKLKYIGLIESESRVGGAFEGGDQVEGSAYGSGISRVVLGLKALERTTGEKFEAADFISSETVKFMIYSTKPNRWQMVDDGEWGGNYGGLIMDGPASILVGMLPPGSQAAQLGVSYLNSLTKPPSPALSGQPWEKFTFATEANPYDYKNLPTVFKAKSSEHVFWRSSWGDDAVWIDFHAGAKNFSGHDNRDAGHFTLQRGNDYLVVDGGQYRQKLGWASSGTGGGVMSNKENTLFFNDFGEYQSAYPGGQSLYGSNKVLSYDSTPDATTYIATDIISAYEQRPQSVNEARRSLRSYTRQAVFVKPGILMLVDNALALKPEYDKAIRFHFGKKPTISGNKLSVTSGSSVATINYFGIDGDLKSLSGSHPVTGMPDDPVYFVDIAPSTHRSTLQTISLVWSGAATEASPSVKMVLSTNKNLVGVIVGDTSPSVLLVPGGDPTSGSNISTSEYSVSVAANHKIFGLQKNTTYKIYLDGAEVTQKTTSSEGRLSFDLSKGGVVKITK